MNRCDRVITLFERYQELVNIAITSGVYITEELQEIKRIEQEKEHLAEELTNHGCRRKK